MFIINDSRCNVYQIENDILVAKRYGESAVFKTWPEAEAALTDLQLRNPHIKAWIEEL